MSTAVTPLRVGLVGCGLIGRRRAAALGGDRLVACTDLESRRAEALATPAGAAVCNSAAELVRRDDVDVIIVSTTHDALAPVAVAALEAGKHVLVEKPGGRSVAEVDAIARAAAAAERLVHVGFNHRYHPAVRRAREIVDRGDLGPMMMVRGRYGHGGRVGYEREWRADPVRCGGGELIDQGVHLIDLAEWFLGEFTEVRGLATTLYWPMDVDDNAFLILRTAGGQVAFLHASCSEWKNLFSFELYGRAGKLHMEGLGGSYGVERLAWYRMRPEMGPPDTTIWEFPGPDTSWNMEWNEFADDIRLGRSPATGLSAARTALKIVEAIYRGGTG